MRWLSVVRYGLAPLVGLGLLIFLPHDARAQKVEVAPGVMVSRKSYDAPVNEQPFYGFTNKTPGMLEADRKFVEDVVQRLGTREKGADQSLRDGWTAFIRSDFVTAGRRFNQAYLLAPGESGIYHAFAALAEIRFNDDSYADELFRVAATRPNPPRGLKAHHGRLLLGLKRPREAQPLLEQSARDVPDMPSTWADLARARLLNGDKVGACEAVSRGEALSPAANVKQRLEAVRQEAACS